MKKIATVVCSLALLTMAWEAASAATPYTTDAARSTLNFVATQYGAPVEGKFGQFKAAIAFADEDLTGSRFDVTVTMKSADAGEDDRNSTLQGTDLFNTAKFPTGRFVTTGFRKLAAGKYEATGKLTLRDVTRDIRLPFTFEKAANGKEAWLKGSVDLNRLDYGIGQGEWKDTSVVGNRITVKFSLRLTPAATAPAK